MADRRKQIVLSEMLHLINSIKEHADELDWKEHIPQIELEYISSKISKLYERSVILNFLNTFEVERPDHSESKPLTLQEAAVAVAEAAAKEPKELEVVKPVNAIADEPDVEALQLSSNFEYTSSQPETLPNKIKETKLTGDTNFKVSTTKNNGNTWVELQTVVDPKKPAIGKLKNAISINQRLQFINNLFKGNVELMNKTIEEFDSLNNLKQAEQKLNDLITQLSWKTDYELFLSFKELIERRFS